MMSLRGRVGQAAIQVLAGRRPPVLDYQLQRRAASGGPPPATDLGLQAPTYFVWGAGTDVGKTLVSCGICSAASRRITEGNPGDVFYFKPVQTGFPQDSDADQVAAVTGADTEIGEHAAQLTHEDVTEFPKLYAKEHGSVIARTEFAWTDPVSPHLAVQIQGRPVSDLEIEEAVATQITRFYEMSAGKPGSLALVETAGAVLSPAPSGRVQADVFRGMRLPGILVGDGRIGGISNTLCALESLHLRGLDVACIVMMDMGLKNDEAVQEIINAGGYGNGLKPPPVIVLPPIPKRRSTHISEQSLRSWFLQSDSKFAKIVELLRTQHNERLKRLMGAKEAAKKVFWWPFTQHGSLGPTDVTVVDSRHGESWAVYRDAADTNTRGSRGTLAKMFDGSGSWWTCGMDRVLHPIISRAVAYGCGRYGHVLFPQQVYQPALQIAQDLISDGPGRGWATRVFFSDDGSTAVEVALKMAFHKYMKDHGLLDKSDAELEKEKFVMLGLDGSYHGDTLGAMNSQAPSVFTGPKQFPWYQPMGVWLQPPSLALIQGEWKLELPSDLSGAPSDAPLTWATRDEAFDVTERKTSALAAHYTAKIRQQIDDATKDGKHVGALLMEGVLHGAGGMVLIDPLYQHLLAQECKARKIPVIMDEIFSGIWRLGRISACKIPRILPDIACYAKLLTGGTVPMAVTLASESVFTTFLGDKKTDALLHGHSYTAHAIGCQAAIASMQSYMDPKLNPNFKGIDEPLVEQWDPSRLAVLSKHPKVSRVVGLGTVVIVEVKGEGTGYEAKGAKEIVIKLRDYGIAARPLGNVVYFMATPTTTPALCNELLDKLSAHLG